MVKTKWEESEQEPGDIPDDLLEIYPDGWFTPEREQISLSSTLAPEEVECLSLKQIAMIEFKLHKGQVTDSLDGFCLALGEKSLCFHTAVCNVDTQQTTS